MFRIIARCLEELLIQTSMSKAKIITVMSLFHCSLFIDNYLLSVYRDAMSVVLYPSLLKVVWLAEKGRREGETKQLGCVVLVYCTNLEKHFLRGNDRFCLSLSGDICSLALPHGLFSFLVLLARYL